MFRFQRAYLSENSKTFRYQDFLIHRIPSADLPRDIRGWYGLRAMLSRIGSSVVQTFDLPKFVQTAEEAQTLSLEFAKQLIDDRDLPLESR